MLDLTRAYDLDFLFPARDRFVGASLRDAGEFARPEVDVIARLLGRAGGTYLDVGANIGSIALPVAAALRRARVIGIEGNRQLANILAANALMNGLTNVDVHHAAAGAEAGLIDFPAPSMDAEINFGALQIAEPAEPGVRMERTRMLTLDEVAPLDTRVVKLDVEGFEPEVLAGATALFGAKKAAWIIEHKSDDRARAITDQFLDGGYRLFWFFAPFVTPSAAKTGIKKGDTVRGDTNLLALPEGDPPMPMLELTSADQPRPKTLDGFPYLKSYGF